MSRYKIILGGALLGALFVGGSALGYSQNTTHPALTNETVNFFNLHFPDRPITEKEKQLLIQGSVDEDASGRAINHLYDPVYNKGWAFSNSAKDWALKANLQANYYNSRLAGMISVTKKGSSADFSYGRALQDYAEGNVERAFLAFGHTLHLLQDMGVPDHTRDDPHPPVLDWGSPYEYDMSKWNPGNFHIAQQLSRAGEKPVIFSSMGDYFENLARYSNSNFFSKDTISNKKYQLPKQTLIKNIYVNGAVRSFIINKDKNGIEFPMALIYEKDGAIQISIHTVDIGSYILDGYWERLSPEIVKNGAGALRLFLEEAEAAKKEYLAKQQEPKPSFLAQMLGYLGIHIGGKDTNNEVIHITPTPEDGQASDGVSPQGQVAVVTQSGVTTNPTVSPVVTLPLSPSVTPLPTVTPLVSPTPSPSPTVSPTPSPLLESVDNLKDIKKTGKVIINELAWMGTDSGSTYQWIELYNSENEPVNLTGWRIVSDDETPSIIIGEDSKTKVTSNPVIQAQGYYLLEWRASNRLETPVNPGVQADWYGTFGSGGLKNAGEVLWLMNSSGLPVDTVGHTGGVWYAGDSKEKMTMERIASDELGTDPANWKNSQLKHGTPKASNSPVSPVVKSGSGGSSSSPSATAEPTPTPTPSPSPTGETESEDDSEEGDTANSGDVVINEIAWMGTNAENGHFDEWIELHNTTSQPINITGWTLKSLASPSFDPDIILSGTISANGYFLLERTDDTTISDILADQIYTGALSDSGEKMELRDVAGEIIDFVDGSSGWSAGDNLTKETMQFISSDWITATPTPRAENKENITLELQTVTNLAVQYDTPQFTLTWLAPSDLGEYNPASLSYDFRYASSAPGATASEQDDWWNSVATPIPIASASLPGLNEEGAPQSASFNTYAYGQKFYFSAKVIHITPTPENGQASDGVMSEMSNIADIELKSALFSHANLVGPTSPTATISWEFNVPAGWGVGQPVIAPNEDIIFGVTNGTNYRLYSISKTGSENWTYESNMPIGTPVVLSDGAVYFGHNKDGVAPIIALNPDGSQRWTHHTSRVQNIAVSNDCTAYFTTKNNPNRLQWINASGEFQNEITNSGAFPFSPVITEDGTIITAGYVSGNQFFNAYDSAGAELWQNTWTMSNGNPPVQLVHDLETGKTYSSAGAWLFELNPSKTIPTAQKLDPNGKATAVAIGPDNLLVGFNDINPASGSRIFSINKFDLTENWEYSVDERLDSGIAIDSVGNSYFSTQDGSLHSLNQIGSENWNIKTDNNSSISPILAPNGLVWAYGGSILLVQ